MDNNFNFRRRQKRPRQEWNPHWILKILYAAWMTLFGLFKIALGAAATVLMILLVCGFVFVGILGEYLEADVLPESEDYVITGVSDLEQTTYVYYVDGNGDIQELQELHTSIDRQWVSMLSDAPSRMMAHFRIFLDVNLSAGFIQSGWKK